VVHHGSAADELLARDGDRVLARRERRQDFALAFQQPVLCA